MTIARLDDPTPEVLREYIEAQQCWWCGRGGWKSLPNHTCKAHGISAAELRELAYLYTKEPVSSQELRDGCRQRTLARKDDWRGSPGGGEHRGHSTKRKDELRARVENLREKYRDVRIEKTRRPHNCRICGTVIPQSTPQLCSDECREISRHQDMSPEGRAKLSATRKERIAAGLISTARVAPGAHSCPICGTWVPRGAPATCSPECAKALTRQKTARPHPCPVCGTVVPTWHPITCSPKCRKVIRQRTALVSAETRKRRQAENPEYGAEERQRARERLKNMIADGTIVSPNPAKPHPCPVCGTIVPKVHPLACSPPCRRVLHQRASAKGVANRKLKIPRAMHPILARQFDEGESAEALAAPYGVTPNFIRLIARQQRRKAVAEHSV